MLLRAVFGVVPLTAGHVISLIPVAGFPIRHVAPINACDSSAYGRRNTVSTCLRVLYISLVFRQMFTAHKYHSILADVSSPEEQAQ